MSETNANVVPMRGHRRTQEIISAIDDGLLEVSFMIEHSVGHLVMTHEIDAAEAYNRLVAYEGVFGGDLPPAA